MANLYYPKYDPLWAACAELELPVHRHSSFPTESVHEGGTASALIGVIEIQFYTMRAIGHMILSSVFERHPDLKFVTTEIANAAEIPGYLKKLDVMVRMSLGEGTPLHEHVGEAVAALRKAPSEYFASNCYVAGPTRDLRQTHDLGLPNLMWGADLPHSEGTSPYTIEVLRTTMWDLPESEIEILLSTRAAEVYKFDLTKLQAVADRVGPTMSEIKSPLPAEQRPKYPEDTRCAIFQNVSSLVPAAAR
jgi:predicted TIM-barrel fold metal-dependent hydrolase